MIKIRLHGTPEEIAQAKEVISEAFIIQSISANYPDRGASVYCRSYIDAVIKDPSENVKVTEQQLIGKARSVN